MRSLGCGAGAGRYYTEERHQRREDYFCRADEDYGRWYAPRWDIVDHEGRIETPDFAALCAGYDPETGNALVQRTGEGHRAGLDITFSAPKSVSVLWASGDHDVRRAISAAQTAAVERALDFATEQGLFRTRTGKDGTESVVTHDVVAGRFRHYTSRAGDPQLHDHAVVLNLTRDVNGATRTMEPQTLFAWQGAIQAAYRVELAEQLRDQLQVQIIKAERNFEIAGVDRNLCLKFSKRRNEILDLAREAGISTREDRAETAYITRNSRVAKSELPSREDLERRWQSEFAAAGWPGSSVLEIARTHTGRRQPLGDPTQDIMQAALAEATERESVIECRHMIRLLLEYAQGRMGVQAVTRELTKLVQSGQLLEIGQDPLGQAVYTTPEMMRIEREMMAAAIARRHEPSAIHHHHLENAIKSRPSLRPEQIAACRHVAIEGGGVSLLEGDAGTGKSYGMAVVAEAARASGLRLHALAPSWKAAEGLRDKIGQTDCQSLAGFIRDVGGGDRRLSAQDMIILDEAGMVGIREMKHLLTLANEAKARVVLVGDRKQLEAIGAGGALAALADELAPARLREITRQEQYWMRKASRKLAAGDVISAVRDYEARDRVVWAAGRNQALSAAVRQWDSYRAADPHSSRIAIAPRNADVRALNEIIRVSQREQGELTSKDVPLWLEHRDGIERETPIAVSDRVVFGEVLTRLGINTSDLGTVTGIGADKGETVLSVRLDKGPEVTAPLTDFVGEWRQQKQPGSLPKIQHAYAGTTHILQGDTVRHVIFYNGAGVDRRQAYVGLTRHQGDVTMVVETSRVRDMLRDRAMPGVPPDLSDARVKQIVLAEMQRVNIKHNIRDYAADPGAWVRTGVFERADRQSAITIPTPAQELGIRMRHRLGTGRIPPTRDPVAANRRRFEVQRGGAPSQTIAGMNPADWRASGKGETCFAWRDEAGHITGYEVVCARGSRHQFPPLSRERGLHIAGNPRTAGRLVITATAAEALSRRGADASRPDTAYIATGGDLQPDQVRRIAGLVAARPELEVELVVSKGVDPTKSIVPLLKELGSVRSGLENSNQDGLPNREVMALLAKLGRTLPAGVILSLPVNLGQGIDRMEGKEQSRGRDVDIGF